MRLFNHLVTRKLSNNYTSMKASDIKIQCKISYKDQEGTVDFKTEDHPYFGYSEELFVDFNNGKRAYYVMEPVYDRYYELHDWKIVNNKADLSWTELNMILSNMYSHKHKAKL